MDWSATLALFLSTQSLIFTDQRYVRSSCTGSYLKKWILLFSIIILFWLVRLLYFSYSVSLPYLSLFLFFLFSFSIPSIPLSIPFSPSFLFPFLFFSFSRQVRLGLWLKKQRQMYRNNSLRVDRKERLQVLVDRYTTLHYIARNYIARHDVALSDAVCLAEQNIIV